MTATQRAAQGILVVLGLLTIVFYSSVYAASGEDAFPADANALIASGGAALGILVIVLATVGLGSGERWAWLALWVLPAFLAAHAVLLGTWVPDGVFAVVSAAALLVTRPRYAIPAEAGARLPGQRTA